MDENGNTAFDIAIRLGFNTLAEMINQMNQKSMNTISKQSI